MTSSVKRQTVDLSAYPDLIVIYLGMRINHARGVLTFLKLGRQIRGSVTAAPDGLLLHENLFFSPRHAGMRQYWRDYESLEAWTRTLPHQDWWRNFLGDSGGTGFWHELYSVRGAMEAVYDDVPVPLGFSAFAPGRPARGRMFGARGRLTRPGESPDPVVAERELA